MFKIYPPTFFLVPVAWLTATILSALNVLTPFLTSLGLTPKTSWAIFVVQAVITVIFVTPLWRVAWRWFPKLNELIYPDLNGEWVVEGHTNWPRIDALLRSANGEAPPLDIRHADDAELPPLGPTIMRARITQSWLEISMTLWNPTGQGPIKESKTCVTEPFRGKEGRHGLSYIFEQENATKVVSDDRVFKGAAWLVRDRDDPDLLCGHMWSDRMWRRGMNTAAEIKFKRVKSRTPSKRRSK